MQGNLRIWKTNRSYPCLYEQDISQGGSAKGEWAHQLLDTGCHVFLSGYLCYVLLLMQYTVYASSMLQQLYPDFTCKLLLIHGIPVEA